MYQNRKIKIYSIIIFVLLVVDFFINFHEKDLPKEGLEIEDYQLINSVKSVINNKKFDQDIIRLSRKKNTHIHMLIKEFLEQLAFFNNDIANKMYHHFESNFLRKRVSIVTKSINLNRYQDILESFNLQDEKTILEKSKNLNVNRYEVFSVGSKARNYIMNTTSVAKRRIIWGNLYVKSFLINQNNQGGQRYDESNKLYNIYACPSIWKKVEELSKENPNTNNYPACRDIMQETSRNAGILANEDYCYIGYSNTDYEKKRQIDFRVNREDMKMQNASCFFCNDIINNYSFDLNQQEELLYVGYIDHVDDLLDYNVLAGVVNSKLDDDLLPCIMRVIPSEIWNNRQRFIVTTTRGLYYIVKKPCKDANTLRKVLAVNKASIVAADTVNNPKTIVTPLRHPQTFIKTMKRCYNINFPDVKSSSNLINYHDLSKKCISISQLEIEFGTTQKNYIILDLLENGYSFNNYSKN